MPQVITYSTFKLLGRNMHKWQIIIVPPTWTKIIKRCANVTRIILCRDKLLFLFEFFSSLEENTIITHMWYNGGVVNLNVNLKKKEGGKDTNSTYST